MYVFSMGLLTKSEQPLRTLCPGGHGSADHLIAGVLFLSFPSLAAYL